VLEPLKRYLRVPPRELGPTRLLTRSNLALIRNWHYY
jgi:hypothetical protein